MNITYRSLTQRDLPCDAILVANHPDSILCGGKNLGVYDIQHIARTSCLSLKWCRDRVRDHARQREEHFRQHTVSTTSGELEHGLWARVGRGGGLGQSTSQCFRFVHKGPRR